MFRARVAALATLSLASTSSLHLPASRVEFRPGGAETRSTTKAHGSNPTYLHTETWYNLEIPEDELFAPSLSAQVFHETGIMSTVLLGSAECTIPQAGSTKPLRPGWFLARPDTTYYVRRSSRRCWQGTYPGPSTTSPTTIVAWYTIIVVAYARVQILQFQVSASR